MEHVIEPSVLAAGEDLSANNSCSLFRENELSSLEWFRRANGIIDQDSFLLRKTCGRELDPQEKIVVVLQEGYVKGIREINRRLQREQAGVVLPESIPRWTSHVQRAHQELHFSGVRQHATALRHQVPLLPQRMGAVEVCKVMTATYHRRIISKYEVGNVPRSAGLFARLTLQRCECEEVEPEAGPSRRSGRSMPKIPKERVIPQPWITVLDYHLDAESDFIIDRKRYRKAVDSSTWAIGDRFQMFWADPEEPTVGAFYTGTIRGRRDYRRNGQVPPYLRDSTWEQLRVVWDADPAGEETLVNVWEIMPVAEEMGRQRFRHSPVDSSDSSGDEGGHSASHDSPLGDYVLLDEMDSDSSVEFFDDEDEGDEEYGRKRRGGGGRQGRAGGSGGGGSRKRPRQQQQQQQQQQVEEPSRRPVIPETMQYDKRKLKVDWNSDYCAFCHEGGELVECDGACLRSFHMDCLHEADRPHPDDPEDALWYCPSCRVGQAQCTVCGVEGVAGVEVFKCKMGNCGFYYHPACLDTLSKTTHIKYTIGNKTEEEVTPEQVAKFFRGKESFTCPAHFCHSCHLSGDSLKMMRCWLCPRGYHVPSCMPAGSCKVPGDSKYLECAHCRSVYHTAKQKALQARAQQAALQQQGQELGQRQGQQQPELQLQAPGQLLKHEALQLEELIRSVLRNPKKANVPSHMQLLQKGSASAASSPQLSRSRSGRLAQQLQSQQASTDAAVGPDMDAGNGDMIMVCHVQRLSPTEQPARACVRKTHWLFGSHSKGGGVDFYVPDTGCKIHSKIIVQPDGCSAVLHFSQGKGVMPPILNGKEMQRDRAVPLQHGDLLQIMDCRFRIQMVGMPAGPQDALDNDALYPALSQALTLPPTAARQALPRRGPAPAPARAVPAQPRQSPRPQPQLAAPAATRIQTLHATTVAAPAGGTMTALGLLAAAAATAAATSAATSSSPGGLPARQQRTMSLCHLQSTLPSVASSTTPSSCSRSRQAPVLQPARPEDVQAALTALRRRMAPPPALAPLDFQAVPRRRRTMVRPACSVSSSHASTFSGVLQAARDLATSAQTSHHRSAACQVGEAALEGGAAGADAGGQIGAPPSNSSGSDCAAGGNCTLVESTDATPTSCYANPLYSLLLQQVRLHRQAPARAALAAGTTSVPSDEAEAAIVASSLTGADGGSADMGSASTGMPSQPLPQPLCATAVTAPATGRADMVSALRSSIAAAPAGDPPPALVLSGRHSIPGRAGADSWARNRTQPRNLPPVPSAPAAMAAAVFMSCNRTAPSIGTTVVPADGGQAGSGAVAATACTPCAGSAAANTSLPSHREAVQIIIIDDDD